MLTEFRTTKALNVTLATSLIHLFPPKHHGRALRIVDDILSQDSNNVQALVGRGYILQQKDRWDEAASSFSRVLQLLPDDDNTAIRAREEHAWCQIQLSQMDAGLLDLRVVIEQLSDSEGKEEDKARCWWRIGQGYWKLGGSIPDRYNVVQCSDGDP